VFDKSPVVIPVNKVAAATFSGAQLMRFYINMKSVLADAGVGQAPDHHRVKFSLIVKGRLDHLLG